MFSLVCYPGEQLLTNNEKGTLYPSGAKNAALVTMTGFYVEYEWSLYTVYCLCVTDNNCLDSRHFYFFTFS